jgi:hypothetical protein
MRSDWLPPSASALVVGAMVLVLGFLLNPLSQETSDIGEAVALAEQADGRWLGTAFLLFFASVCLTLGLPALLSLFDRRARRFGAIAVGLFSVGTVGLSAYGMLLVFLRAAMLNDFVKVGGSSGSPRTPVCWSSSAPGSRASTSGSCSSASRCSWLARHRAGCRSSSSATS